MSFHLESITSLRRRFETRSSSREVKRAAFAGFSGLFDFRLLQQYLPKAAITQLTGAAGILVPTLRVMFWCALAMVYRGNRPACWSHYIKRCEQIISLNLNQVLLTAITALVFAPAARATDEIQVYNGRIAAPGQFTIQQHLNFIGVGQRQPEFPGGLISDRSLNGTPEFAYGVTNWWEVGLYLPFSVESGGQFHSNAFKLRTLFVSPNAEDRDTFYGVNFEFSHTTPRFAETKFGVEIRPILGLRNGDYEFIVNPIVGIGIGKNGQADFTPAARVARRIEPNLF